MIFGIISTVVLIAAVGIFLARLRRTYRMQLVTCVIRPEQLGDVTSALLKNELSMGMTVINVRGFGRQKGDAGESDAEAAPIRFLPKLKLEILVRQPDRERTIQVIGDAVRTGEIGDGKVIVFDAVAAMRIRTGETGISAL